MSSGDPATVELMSDPLLAYKPMTYSATCYPLGFGVTLQSNSVDLIELARSDFPSSGLGYSPTLRLQIGVVPSAPADCPPAPRVRAQEFLLTILCDAGNFVVLDLRAGFGFGWLSSSVLLYPDFVRYHLLDAAMLSLLSATRITPLHAACVTYAGRGFLFHGRSGAGKSTLAYACARRGWTYTTDDASYLLRDSADLLVRGNSSLLRFRPSACTLFPELSGRTVTPRCEGKPSIEVRTRELPGIAVSTEAPLYAFIALDRTSAGQAFLSPLTAEEAMNSIEQSLFPVPVIRDLQRPSAERVLSSRLFTLRYSDLDQAIDLLEGLAEEGSI